MSDINIDRGLSYTIPVDSIDLKYLSKFVSSSTGMVPLWTKTRLDGETGYCQVQILTQNDEECYSEPTDTYECHICNVHVPVTCSKEHNESEQHKTIKNIYQKVLEKLSKQIDMSIVEHDEKIDKDTYYCVPCSKIIKKENKDKHESSEFHAKSNKDAIIISEFYKIIKEDKSHTNDIILNDERLGQDSDLEPVNTKSFTENNNYDKTINKLNNNSLDNGHDYSTDLLTYANKLAKPGPSKNDSIIQPPYQEKADTFEEYLKAMIKKYKLKVNLPLVMSKEICIESSNGDTVKVSQEHFQSYKLVGNSIYCQLCKMWISHDTKPHDVTKNHVRNIFKPINEKFARMIDSVSSHCVPCNYVVLTNSAQHTLDDLHKKIVKDTRVQKVGKTYCEDCNLFIDTHNFSVHIISKKHLNSIMIKKINPKTFFCEICNSYLSKNGLKNHVVSKIHLINKTNDVTTKIDSFASISTSSSISDATNITDDEFGEYSQFLYYTDDAETKINCVICEVNIPNVDRNIIEHMEGRNHEIAVTRLLEFHLMTKESSGYVCECCWVHTTDFFEHINSRSHTNAIIKKLKIGKNEFRKYVYEDDSNDLVALQHRELYWNLLEDNDISRLNDTSYYCGMCQIKLGRISELDHVLGARHAMKLAEIEDP